ncbi:MAG: hypothetical protein LUE31_08245 [Lachnospiraceae bacterium]|nr:hypothetical protein [Lachnospiraceae bacterium]
MLQKKAPVLTDDLPPASALSFYTVDISGQTDTFCPSIRHNKAFGSPDPNIPDLPALFAALQMSPAAPEKVPHARNDQGFPPVPDNNTEDMKSTDTSVGNKGNILN